MIFSILPNAKIWSISHYRPQRKVIIQDSFGVFCEHESAASYCHDIPCRFSSLERKRQKMIKGLFCLCESTAKIFFYLNFMVDVFRILFLCLATKYIKTTFHSCASLSKGRMFLFVCLSPSQQTFIHGTTISWTETLQ